MPEPFVADVTATSGDRHTVADLRDRFTVRSDEPSWLPDPLGGADDHPAPVDYLLASLALCQVSVLQQCLQANGVDPYRIDCEATVDGFERAPDLPDVMPEHTAGRIEHVTVRLVLSVTDSDRDRADACLASYDDGCIVGQSIGVDYTPLTALEVRPDPLDQ
jgi:uncharacterized OsmC-like protein